MSAILPCLNEAVNFGWKAKLGANIIMFLFIEYDSGARRVNTRQQNAAHARYDKASVRDFMMRTIRYCLRIYMSNLNYISLLGPA